MAETVVDILEGSAGSHDILRGWNITRVAIITGLQAAATLSLSGVTTNGSGTITIADTTGILKGMSIAGTGIPVPSKVMSITTNTNIVISNTVSGSGTVTLSFGSLDTQGLLQAAEGLVIAAVGDRGSLCPNVGVPTFLKTITPELLAPDVAKVKIAYEGYPLPTYEFDGGLNQVESNRDVNGSLVLVSYTYPSTYLLDPRKAGQTITQGGMVSRSIPETTVTVRWLITAGYITSGTTSTAATATEILAWFKTNFEGKVNDGSYTVGAFTGAARTWLVEKVSGTTKDGGLTYEAAMTFHYKINTWDQLVVFINPDDGKPPPDLVLNTGYKMVQTIPTASMPTFTFPPN